MFKLDLSAFNKAAKDLGASIDQVPYALSRSINDAAKVTYSGLVNDTWSQHVTVRKPGFMKWALRTKFSTKQNLSIEINDEKAQGRGHLSMHDTGGTKTARGRLALPDYKVKRSGRGVAKGMRPMNIPGSFIKGDILYQRRGPKNPIYIKKNGQQGKTGGSWGGGRRGLDLLYTLKPSAPIKADVPFSSDFERMMSREIAKAFPKRIAEAMAARK